MNASINDFEFSFFAKHEVTGSAVGDAVNRDGMIMCGVDFWVCCFPNKANVLALDFCFSEMASERFLACILFSRMASERSWFWLGLDFVFLRLASERPWLWNVAREIRGMVYWYSYSCCGGVVKSLVEPASTSRTFVRRANAPKTLEWYPWCLVSKIAIEKLITWYMVPGIKYRMPIV